MSADQFLHAMERLLAHYCTPSVVRSIEGGGPVAVLRDEVAGSGFADLLVPESRGGGGLSLADVGPVLFACAGHLLPLPLDATMLVRAVNAATPEGFVAIAPRATILADGAIECRGVPDAATADWVLAAFEHEAVLLPAGAAESRSPQTGGSIASDLRWRSLPRAAVGVPGNHDWFAAGAMLMAARIAGAMDRVLAITLAHAAERTQFGKPLAQFQAIQQQLAVMAEEVAAARMAASLGLGGEGLLPDALRAAVAKARASAAVPSVVSIAHAVHGAIGIAAEFDLQLFTRRLHAWRLAFGSEAHWHGRVGRMLLADGSSALDAVVRRVARQGLR